MIPGGAAIIVILVHLTVAEVIMTGKTAEPLRLSAGEIVSARHFGVGNLRLGGSALAAEPLSVARTGVHHRNGRPPPRARRGIFGGGSEKFGLDGDGGEVGHWRRTTNL